LFTVVFVAAALLATFLEDRALPFFLIGLIGPFVLAPHQLADGFRNLGKAEIYLLVSIAAFCMFFATVALIRWEPYDDVFILRPQGIENPFEWAVIGGLALVTFLRAAAIPNLNTMIRRYFVPLVGFGLVYAFVFYTTTYLELAGTERACRTGLGIFNINVFAFFVAIVFSFGFALFLSDKASDWRSFGIVSLGLFALIVLTGSRMAILCYVLTAVLISLFACGGRFKIVVFTLGALVGAGALGVLVNEALGCNFLARVQVLADAANAQTSNSSARRIELWEIGLSALKDHWLFGLGIKTEAVLSYPNAHLHNQYLSWTIWGGIPGLLAGLVLFLALPIYGWVKAGAKGFAVGGACTGFAAMNLLTDSVLYFSNAFGQFLILFAFIAAAISQMKRASI